jgi:hypothetical protein
MNSEFIQALKAKLPRRLLAKLGLEKKLNRRLSSKLSCVNEIIISKFEATLLGDLITYFYLVKKMKK